MKTFKNQGEMIAAFYEKKKIAMAEWPAGKYIHLADGEIRTETGIDYYASFNYYEKYGLYAVKVAKYAYGYGSSCSISEKKYANEIAAKKALGTNTSPWTVRLGPTEEDREVEE